MKVTKLSLTSIRIGDLYTHSTCPIISHALLKSRENILEQLRPLRFSFVAQFNKGLNEFFNTSKKSTNKICQNGFLYIYHKSVSHNLSLSIAVRVPFWIWLWFECGLYSVQKLVTDRHFILIDILVSNIFASNIFWCRY